jgi:uncharacterized Zn-binding protein involved in type VI secretion
VPIATGLSSLGAATDDIPTQATSGTVTQTNDDGVRSLTLSYGWWVSLGVPGQASASVLRISGQTLASAYKEQPGRLPTMPPAARVTDMHTCPMVTGVVPHAGGPILPPGCPTVLIGGIPAARATDMATCVGPPDTILMGSSTVLIGNMMAARVGDPTAHGGVIVLGCPTVIIG